MYVWTVYVHIRIHTQMLTSMAMCVYVCKLTLNLFLDAPQLQRNPIRGKLNVAISVLNGLIRCSQLGMLPLHGILITTVLIELP